MAFDGMSVVIDADIKGYERELKRAEAITNRFAGKVAQGLGLGDLARLGVGAGLAMKGFNEATQLAGDVLNRFNDIAIGKATSGIKEFDKTLSNLRTNILRIDKDKGLWADFVDRIAVTGAFVASGFRVPEQGLPTSQFQTESERLTKIYNEQQMALENVGKTSDEVLRAEIQRWIDVSASVEFATQTLELFERRLSATEAHARAKKLSADALDELGRTDREARELLSADIQRQHNSRMLRMEQARINAEEEQARMFERSGFGDPEDPTARFEEAIDSLERQIAEASDAGRMPGLAVRDSQEAASIINAQKQREDSRHQQTMTVLQQQLQTAQQQLQFIRQTLSGSFNIN